MKTVLNKPLAVGYVLVEDVGNGVIKLASGERVGGDACLS